MPRNTKDYEDEERDDTSAPRVDEIEPDDRAQSKLDDEEDDRDDEDVDEDDVVEEIDLDDLSAMEGPDA
jgi:hypothetical protein